MRPIILSFLLSVLFIGALSAQPKEINIKLIHTSDIHGTFFPFDFINNRPCKGSLARVSSFVNEQRKKYPAHVLLLDGGDLLQGQPSVYYYNFVDTVSPNICAEVMNYLQYDAITVGNHDVETGHAVYDRWISQCKAPVLGANVLKLDGSNYLKPYKIFVIDGVKIAVLGLITPSIPAWLPKNLWEGLYFEDMEISAKKWMKVIRETEQPDVVIGLFHSGVEPYKLDGLYNENASAVIAKEVPGFDVVMAGHDHERYCKKLRNVAGDSVLVINPSKRGEVVSDILLKVKMNDGKVVGKCIKGKLRNMKNYQPDEIYMQHFAPQVETVKAFVSRPIGRFDRSIDVHNAYIGPSAFIDLIHSLQLDLTGADVSFTAPLSYNAHIEKGTVYVRDMFNLYEFENKLYVMELTGAEIKGYLEESYAIWTNQMKSPQDHLLLLKPINEGKNYDFVNYSFNFDSAAGINYTVDVTKPAGKKIHIVRMSNGKPFDLRKRYKVAINSYRANGGGELLTKGAGIPHDSLKSRILTTSAMDLRHYLMKQIESKGTISPRSLNEWKFIPVAWTKPAAKRDLQLFFQK